MKCSAIRIALVAALATALGACGSERQPLPGAGKTPGESAAVSTPAARPTPPPAEAGGDDGHEMPLKAEGIGSAAELGRSLAKLDDATARAKFEAGFRACFVTDQSRRDYALALAAMTAVLEAAPDFAPAYRTMAYAKLNTGFDMAGATEDYEKAVAADPEYGEAHYALAFMLTQFDPERGRVHFEKAMALGVPDERSLGDRFYPAP